MPEDLVDASAGILETGNPTAIVALVGILSLAAVIALVVFVFRSAQRIAAGWNESTERIVDRYETGHREAAEINREAMRENAETTRELRIAIEGQTKSITQQTEWFKATR